VHLAATRFRGFSHASLAITVAATPLPPRPDRRAARPAVAHPRRRRRRGGAQRGAAYREALDPDTVVGIMRRDAAPVLDATVFGVLEGVLPQ
jgi:hypothetical protein